MERGAWGVAVHGWGLTELTQLKRLCTHTYRGFRTRKASKGKKGALSQRSGSRSALDFGEVREGPTDKPAFE